MATAQQRIVAECTVVYKVESHDASDGSMRQKATKTVYIKSNNARIDLVAPAYAQSTIYNKSTGMATVLRSFGEDKYMTSLNAKQWRKLNMPLDSMQIQLTTDSISVLDYSCKKALLQLKNGTTVTVYYTTAIIPSVRDYEYMFKDIPGFATSRLGVVLGNEAIRMLADGVASAKDIDTAMVLGYKHPMGPLALTDLVGLDVRRDILKNLQMIMG